jgi:hypothetical protein
MNTVPEWLVWIVGPLTLSPALRWAWNKVKRHLKVFIRVELDLKSEQDTPD